MVIFFFFFNFFFDQQLAVENNEIRFRNRTTKGKPKCRSLQKISKIVLWTDSNGRPRPVVYDKQEPRYKEDATNGSGISV
jgi:hypothetical protein